MGREQKRAEFRNKEIKRQRVMIGLVGLGLAAIMVTLILIVGDGASVNSTQAAPVPDQLQYDPMPEFALSRIDGSTLSSSELANKTVVINFWASWCPPCRSEMPSIESFYQEHRDENLIVVAVNAGESPEQIEQFVQEHDLTFEVVQDPTMQMMAQFGVLSLPTTFIIDQRGDIRGQHMGQLDEQQLESMFRTAVE
jgi:thiol-disulfide isomerase/thioredoxin